MLDIQHMALSFSMGELLDPLPDDDVRVDLTVSAKGPDDDSNLWFVSASISVIANRTDLPQYHGKTQYAVIAQWEGVRHIADLYTVIWPHLRADLALQCSRIAHKDIGLPWYPDFRVIGSDPMDLNEAADSVFSERGLPIHG